MFLRSLWCRCTQPPPVEHETEFELQGDPGKKNGEKVGRLHITFASYALCQYLFLVRG